MDTYDWIDPFEEISKASRQGHVSGAYPTIRSLWPLKVIEWAIAKVIEKVWK